MTSPMHETERTQLERLAQRVGQLQHLIETVILDPGQVRVVERRYAELCAAWSVTS